MFYVSMGYSFILLYILLFKIVCLKNSEKNFHFFKALTGYESLFFSLVLII